MVNSKIKNQKSKLKQIQNAKNKNQNSSKFKIQRPNPIHFFDLSFDICLSFEF